jgi:protein-S-isoprenylcysteine O-methyltransferase Ste14
MPANNGFRKHHHVVDGPKRILPPVYFLAALLSMAVLHFVFPVARIFRPFYFGGGTLILVGVAVILWAARLFSKAGTTIKPFQEPSKLVVGGPYRWSRNPIYLGMVVILIGVGLVLGTLSSFVIVPLFIWLIRKRFILPEEAMLEKSFGFTYAEYKRLIRRWL